MRCPKCFWSWGYVSPRFKPSACSFSLLHPTVWRLTRTWIYCVSQPIPSFLTLDSSLIETRIVMMGRFSVTRTPPPADLSTCSMLCSSSFAFLFLTLLFSATWVQITSGFYKVRRSCISSCDIHTPAECEHLIVCALYNALIWIWRDEERNAHGVGLMKSGWVREKEIVNVSERETKKYICRERKINMISLNLRHTVLVLSRVIIFSPWWHQYPLSSTVEVVSCGASLLTRCEANTNTFLIFTIRSHFSW